MTSLCVLFLKDITQEIHSHLTSDDVSALSTNTVPVLDNFKDDCNHLMQEILNSSRASFNSQEVLYVNKSSARKYNQSKEGETGVVSFHVDSCSINDEVIFQRTDHRVSKEILQCKVHLTPSKYEFVSEYQAVNTTCSERRRIRFHFNHVMGMSLSGKVLSIDICNIPIFERKLKTKCKWDADCSSVSKSETATRWRVVIVSHEETEHQLLPKLSRVDVLACALKTSLLDDYPEFNPLSTEDSHERLPLLKDPTLVRATQLAILEIAEDPRSRHDVQFVVKMYMGIEKAFRRLLQARLENNSSQENHEQ